MYVFQIAWLNLGHVLSIQETTNFLLGKCLIRLNDISFFTCNASDSTRKDSKTND